MKLPKFARVFLFDAITTAAAGLLALSVAGDPATVLKSVAIAIGGSLAAAAVRALPGFNEWLAAELNISE